MCVGVYVLLGRKGIYWWWIVWSKNIVVDIVGENENRDDRGSVSNSVGIYKLERRRKELYRIDGRGNDWWIYKVWWNQYFGEGMN